MDTKTGSIQHVPAGNVAAILFNFKLWRVNRRKYRTEYRDCVLVAPIGKNAAGAKVHRIDIFYTGSEPVLVLHHGTRAERKAGKCKPREYYWLPYSVPVYLDEFTERKASR